MKLGKRAAVGISAGVVLGLGLIGGGVAAYMYVTSQFEEYELAIATRDSTLQTLQGKLDEIGDLTTCYELNYDVKGGTIISEADLLPVEIPAKAATGYVQDANEIIGKYYKTALGQGTVLGESMVSDYELTGDLRYLDVTVDDLPIGLEVGDYVDIRFRFTFGQNYIVMTHKQVVEINKNVLKLVVDEKDIHSYESMWKDKAQYVGCRVSAVQYIEGGIQDSGLNYYPIRIDVLSTLVQDPNIKDQEDISQFTLVDRELLEQQLITQADLNLNDQTLEQEIKKIYADSIQEGEEYLDAAYEEAAEYYNQVKAAEALGDVGGGASSSGGNADEISLAMP